jgi:hypothetical protein
MAEPRTTEVDPYAPPIPPQVRRRARQAEELQKQIAEQEGGQPEGGEAPQETPPQEGSERPPIQEPPAQDAQPPAEWEQRYRTLQGKYDREIPQMRAQVQSLENLIATMRTAPPPPQMPAPESVPAYSPVSEEDQQAYGPELIEASRRWARGEVQAELNELRGEIRNLRAGQDRQTAQTATNRLERELDSDPELANGNWQRLNHDPNFIQWLQEIDPFSGVSRYVMLNHAYSGGDADRTGRFFKAYMREHTDRNPPPSSPPQTYNGANGYVDTGQPPRLEDFAAPGRASRATPGGGAPEKRIWTNRDITAFYEDRTRGKYRGREDEAERLERDIFDAASEGRVRNA